MRKRFLFWTVTLLSLAYIMLLPAVILAEGYEFVTKWGTNGTGNGQFIYPIGVAADSEGNVYVTDKDNDRIQKFNSNGTYITQWGTNGTKEGQFLCPYGVAVDNLGNVYVADTIKLPSFNDRIQKFNSNGTYITQWGAYGTKDGQFNFPSGVAVDGEGNVYVADRDNYRIQKFSSNGAYITQWGINGTGNGQFKCPHGVAADSEGNVYVVDREHHRIQKFNSDGIYITKWGTYGSGNGQFYFPRGVAVDSLGNIYVADTQNNRIQKFDSNGIYITKWGTYGSGNGQFYYPQGVAADSLGNVYVADTYNHRIQVFRSVSQMDIITTCPVDITITDPNGRKFSRTIKEIPDAIYTEADLDGDGDPDDKITVTPLDGEYLIKVTPEPDAKPTDTFTLYVEFKGEKTTLSENVKIRDIPSVPYDFNPSGGKVDLKAGWNMVSFPGTLPDPNPASLIKAGSQIQLPFYRYDPVKFSYEEATQIKLGEGYWALALLDEILKTNITFASSCTVNLKAGWNMIGGVKGNVDMSNPQDTPDNSIMPPIYTYNPTSFGYVDKTSIEPWLGYWVLALNDCTLKLESTTPSPPSMARADRMVDPDWIVPIQMNSKGITKEIALGVHQEATEGFDPKIDIALPPDTDIMSSDISFAINDRLVNRLSRDIRNSDTGVWKVYARVGTDSELTWDMSSVPNDKDITLKFGTSEIDMRNQRSIMLPDGIHQLEIRLSNRIPKSTSLLQNYPNPFNPETWIPYELSKGNPVIISIYNTEGKLVRKLDLGYREAGIYVSQSKSAYWDGRNEVGEKVSSGVYFYNIKAGDFVETKKLAIVK